MNNQELKPCPFCGNEAVSIQSESDHPEYGSGGRFYYVRCPSCRAQSGSKYAHEVCPIFYSEVRQEWNNRAAPPAPFVDPGLLAQFNRHRLLQIIVTGPDASGAEQNTLARIALAFYPKENSGSAAGE